VIDAIESFLATPRCNESAHTRRVYGDVLHRVGELLGPCRALVDIDDEEIAAALHRLWSSAAPATFNRNRATLASWLSWCAHKAQWSAPALPATCERRKQPTDQTKAVDATVIDRMCTRCGNDCSGACSMRQPHGPARSWH
jgi:hypothetical protein